MKNPLNPMKTGRSLLVAALAATTLTAPLTAGEGNFDDLIVWHTEPTDRLNYGLPLGNGHHGAVFLSTGGKDIINLAVNTLWSRGTEDYNKKGAHQHLPELWRLLDERKFAEAHKLMSEFTYPNVSKRLEKLGDLYLTFPGHEEIENYRHELDLNTATRTVTYTHDGATFTRRAFLPAGDQVLVMELSCDQPGRITFDAEFNRDILETVRYDENGEVWTRHSKGKRVRKEIKIVEKDFNAEILPLEGSQDTLIMRGTADPAENGVRWEARLKAIATGGQVSTSERALSVKGADRVVLLVAMGTNFEHYQGVVDRDPAVLCAKLLALAEKRSVAEMHQDHLANHQRYFQSCSLDLGDSTPEQKALPTDERLKRIKSRNNEGRDPDLDELLFQMGRYLVLSSSRPGFQASSLYGVWPESYGKTGENCGFHMDINVTQHYGPSLLTGLAECHLPLTEFAKALIPHAQVTAREVYGNEGAVMNLNPDGWLNTGMYGGVYYSVQWVGAYGWLSQRIWDHYDFTRDETYLRETAMPVLTEAIKFFMDYSRVNPETGKIQIGPSGSPEHGFMIDGGRFTVDYGIAIDQEIAWELSEHLLTGAKVLGIEDDFTAKVRDFQSKLAMPAISQEGRMLEWRDEREGHQKSHRHHSHMYGYYPGDRITMLEDPETAAAVRKSLDLRLADSPYGNIVWSVAKILVYWARLHDADKAYDQLMKGVYPRVNFNMIKSWSHPFCMDANGDFTSGMVEMLMQSHAGGIIHLFPAKPKQWDKGSFTGLQARGAVSVDGRWDADGAEFTFTAKNAGDYRIKLGSGEIQTIPLKAGQAHTVQMDLGGNQ